MKFEEEDCADAANPFLTFQCTIDAPLTATQLLDDDTTLDYPEIATFEVPTIEFVKSWQESSRSPVSTNCNFFFV